MSVLYNLSFREVNGKRHLVGFQTLEINQRVDSSRVLSEHVEQSGVITYSIMLDKWTSEFIIDRVQALLEGELQPRETKSR